MKFQRNIITYIRQFQNLECYMDLAKAIGLYRIELQLLSTIPIPTYKLVKLRHKLLTPKTTDEYNIKDAF